MHKLSGDVVVLWVVVHRGVAQSGINHWWQRLSEVRQVPASEGLRQKVQEKI